MKKESNNHKYADFLVTIPWIMGMALLIIWSFKKGYIGLDTNDDIYMSMFNCGTYGTMDPHNVFNNIVLGWVYVFFYKLFPSHNWNTLFQLFVIFTSYTIFGVANIYRNKPLRGYLSSLIVLMATWESLVCRINFSKTGALALSAGLFVLVVSLSFKEFKSVPMTIFRVLAYCLLIGGGLIRKDTLYAAIPYGIIAILYLVIKFKKEALKRLIHFAVIVSAILMLWIGNDIAYSSNPEWNHYMKVNAARSVLLDYSLPTYYSHMEEYGELGLSENDFWTLKRWVFADENVFPLEVLEKLVEIRNAELDEIGLTDKINNIFESFFKFGDEYIAFYSIIFLFMVLVIMNKKKCNLYLVLTFLSFIGEFALLILGGRTIERGFYIPILLAIITIFLYQDDKEEIRYAELSAILLIFVVVYTFYAGKITSIGVQFEGRVYDKTKINSVLSYTEDHSDNLYAIDGIPESVWLIQSFGPFDSMANVHYNNLTYLGGWQVPAPTVLNIARPYGNPYNMFEMMATNDSVFWISEGNPEGDNLSVFVEEHYFKKVKVVDVVGEYYICSFE